MDYFDSELVRYSALFLACIVIGLPPWVFILYPTEEALTYLSSPGAWVLAIGTWLVMVAAAAIAQR